MKSKTFKNLILVILFLPLSFPICAQWSVGVRSGLHFGKQKAYYDGYSIYDYTTKSISGVEFGFVGKRCLKYGLEVGTELNYVQKGQKIPNSFVLKLSEIELSLFFSYKYKFKRVSVFGKLGGFAGYVITGKATSIINEVPFKYDYDFSDAGRQRHDFGIFGGGGLEIELSTEHAIFIESRYRYSLNYFIDSFREEPSLIISIRNLGLGVSLGYVWTFE